jgi:hypothetical protein
LTQARLDGREKYELCRAGRGVGSDYWTMITLKSTVPVFPLQYTAHCNEWNWLYNCMSEIERGSRCDGSTGDFHSLINIGNLEALIL